MHVEASGTATFRLKATNAVITVSATDLDWYCQGDSERNMGPELVHSAEFDVAGYTVTWNVWEYPIGVENHSDTDVPDELTLLTDIEYGPLCMILSNGPNNSFKPTSLRRAA